VTVRIRKYRGGPELEVEIYFPWKGKIFRRRKKSPFTTKKRSEEWGLEREQEYLDELRDPEPERSPHLGRGLSTRGFRPPPGTRQIPEGIPEGWRIRSTHGEGGVWYYDPTNKGNAVRVMPGDPTSPFPNSQSPYVRWQRNGQPLDVNGNVVPTKYSPDAHIPLNDFRFNPDLFK
jgi:hypothetical protein